MTSPPPRPPSIVLAEEIRRLGLPQKRFAELLNITAQYLSMLVNGRRPFNRAICQQLAKHTNYSEEQWIAMSVAAEHDESREDAAMVGGCLSNEGIHRAVKAGKLDIQPLDKESIVGASLLLRPGPDVRVYHLDKTVTSHRVDRGVVLKPNEIATFETLESLTINGFATLMEPVAELGLEFVQMIAAPPGTSHSGPVRVMIKNLGFDPYELNDLPVARLRFLVVGDMATK